VSLPQVDNATKDIQLKPKTDNRRRSPAENSARIRDLGFTTSKHIKMYGERFELVSDPFEEGLCTVVRVLTRNNPTVRILHLPTAILVGSAERFQKN
jgi:predicted fused transcriptional regulator/phosphomethylpyrimidine kinase